MTFIITSNSVPVYDTFGASDYWGCIEWITWHKELLKEYSRDEADRRWFDAWVAGVSKGGGGKGTAPGSGYIFDSVPIDCRTFNKIFIDYVKKYPILNDAVFTGVLGSTLGVVTSTSVNVTKNIFDTIFGVSDGLSNFSKTLKWLIPLLAFLSILLIVLFIYTKYIKKT